MDSITVMIEGEDQKTRKNLICTLGGYVDGHNCHALGCLHLINNSCPIYRRMTNDEGGKNEKICL